VWHRETYVTEWLQPNIGLTVKLFEAVLWCKTSD